MCYSSQTSQECKLSFDQNKDKTPRPTNGPQDMLNFRECTKTRSLGTASCTRCRKTDGFTLQT